MEVRRIWKEHIEIDHNDVMKIVRNNILTAKGKLEDIKLKSSRDSLS